MQIYGTKSQWNGLQLQGQSDTVLNQSISYGYGDGFNRLTSRTVTIGIPQNYTYSYDLYGNRLSQTPLQRGFSFNAAYSTTTNQITTSGYTYDAAGNMTNGTFHSYQHDAEGNILQVGGGNTAQCVYDVFNRRIHVQTPSATGNEARIYSDGQQIGYRSTDGTTYRRTALRMSGTKPQQLGEPLLSAQQSLMTLFTIAAGIDGVRPGRGASFSNPLYAPQQKSPSPQRRHPRADLQLFTNLLVLFTFSRQQHNAAAQRYPHGKSATTHLPLHLTPTLRVQNDRTG
jgi:YD repeat-containing protein